VAVLVIWTNHGIPSDWTFLRDSLLESIITTTVLALIGIIISNTFRYYQPVSKNFYLLGGYIILLTALTGRTLYLSFSSLHADDAHYQEHYLGIMPLRGIYYLLMITLMTIFFWFRNKIEDQTRARQRGEEAEKLMREAELSRLRLQLQPHFLFNSLNSISALAGSKPEEARKMIQQLSDFLRGTLRKDDQQLVSVHEELRHLTLYLDIEKVRFGHRLKTELIRDEITDELKVPSLLLQPIVENAVKFGLYDTTEAIVIRIETGSEEGLLVVKVQNHMIRQQLGPTVVQVSDLAPYNGRLYLLYGRNDLLTTSHLNGIFTTTLKIPQYK
jgi:two-component system LytT family sensor kinase